MVRMTRHKTDSFDGVGTGDDHYIEWISQLQHVCFAVSQMLTGVNMRNTKSLAYLKIKC